MKVYKVVGPYEVEKHTMDGWALDKVLGHSYADKIQCQTPVSSQVPDNCYGGVSSHPRDEVVQVHEPLFLLVKDLELIQKEVMLTDEVTDLKKKLELKQKERDQWEQAAGRFNSERQSAVESRRLLDEMLVKEQASKQKLEKDIGKLRVAIGDLRMKEILDA